MTDKTGCEMEAMTGCSIAALTVYDMCKGIDKSIVINDLKLLSKTGGKSGDFKNIWSIIIILIKCTIIII